MTTINTNTSSTTAYVVTPDTTGTFVVKTGSGAGTTAMTLDSSQNATFAGTVSSSAGTLISQAFTLLGTLTTTSGTTQTLSGLDLTSYKFLTMALDGVSYTLQTGVLTVAGIALSGSLGTASLGFTGLITIDLSSGVTGSSATSIATGSGAAGNNVYSGRLPITTATTSITFSGGTFDAGTVKFYGAK
jgi:hypothetical protein